MKHTLIYFFLLINTITFGQNAIADLKFEEAEIAFNNGNYDLTLKKIAEYEKVKGNTTAKSLYLTVVAQDKLFNPDNFYADQKQLDIYNSLIVNTNKYLKAMENEGLDDKYREVYAISEKIKELNLPKDKEGWQIGNKALEDQKRIEEERAKIELKKNQDYVLSLALKYFFKPNMTLTELANLNERYKDISMKKGYWYTSSYRKKRVNSRGNPYACGGEIISDENEIIVMMTLRPCVKRAGKQLEELNEFQYLIKQNIDKEYIKENVVNDYSYGKITTIVVNVPGTNFEITTSLNGSSFQLDFNLVP